MNLTTKKMRMLALLAASTCTLGLSTSGRAQPAGGNVVVQDFEDNEPGWFKFGDGAKVGISREAENVHGGQAALQFNYSLQPRQIEALALTNTAPLAAANKISFWAKPATEATMTFAIQERGGAMWMALFNLPKGKWQRVELSASDFTTGFNEGDVRDEDNKLSLDKIEWAGLGDFGQYLMQDPKPEMLKLFGIEAGPRTLWLDDITFDPTRPTPVAADAKVITVDSFAAPQLNWVHLGETQIVREEKQIGGAGGAKVPGLSMSYTQAPGQFSGVARRVNSAGWTGASKISMRLASDSGALLALQLEERGGGKYYVPIIAAGDGEAKTLSFDLSQFKASDDSRDGNGTLDVDQVQQIMLIDLAVMNPQAAKGNNSVWVGDISVQK